MNIVIFHFPFFSTLGGLEKQTIDLFTGLRGLGHHISYCGPGGEVLFEEMQKNGFYTVPTRAPRMAATLGSGLKTLLMAPLAIRTLKKRLAELYRPGEKNIAFLISLNEKILATSPALELGYKVIWVEHVQIGKWLEKHPFRRRYNKLSRQVTIVTPSQMNAKLLEKIGAQNIQVIPNGIEVLAFQNRIHSRTPKPKSETKIGIVARLNGQIIPEDLLKIETPLPGAYHDKGTDIFIRAISELRKDFPDIEGHVAGTGPDKKLFEDLAKKLHAPVKFHGYLTGSNYINFLRDCDIFVAPSTGRDSFNIAVGEALASGLPTIVSNQIGIRDLFPKELVVIPGRDPEALKKAIASIIRDPGPYQEMAKRGQKTAIKELDLKIMVDRYQELFLQS